MKRIALGFLAAPLPAAFIQSVVVAIWPKPGKGVFEHPGSMFAAVCILLYCFELVLALPLYVAMRKRLPEKMSTYGLVGTSIVLLPIVAALIWTIAKSRLSAYAVAYNLVFFAVGGFLAGATFWLITKPQRGADLLNQTFA